MSEQAFRRCGSIRISPRNLFVLFAFISEVSVFAHAGFLGKHKLSLAPLSLNDMSLRRNVSKRVQQNIPTKASQIATPASRGGSLHMVPGAVFDNTPFWQASSTILSVNALGFVISLFTGSHAHLDLLGTGAFAVAALPPLLAKGSLLTRIKVSSLAVFVWGTKLAGFLFFRALKLGHDKRLDETLSTASGTFGFWFISALWGVVCSLPHTLGTTSSGEGNSVCLGVGTAMYIAGILTETMADYQKWNFKKMNPGKFCDVGVWSISQHPNFFGNLLLWSGILVMNAPALIAPLPSGGGILGKLGSFKRLFTAFLSPLFMWLLFSGQANGSITNSVELANQKYGSDPTYKEYVETVPLIIPNFFKK